jgi:hypothetical protein
MPLPYRVRKLSTVGPGVVDRTSYGRGSAGLFTAASEQAGAVYDIDAQEFTVSTKDEVDLALKNGQLKTTDLVFENGMWISLADSIEFEDTARGKAGFESFERNVPHVLMGLGAFALMVGLIVLRMLAHR